MKAYTDIEQSKKLAEILPLESADMWWNYYSVTTDFGTPQIIHLDTPWVGSFNWYNEPDNIPCWSLAALMELTPNDVSLLHLEDAFQAVYDIKPYHITNRFDNPLDAVFEIVCWLKENNKL